MLTMLCRITRKSSRTTAEEPEAGPSRRTSSLRRSSRPIPEVVITSRRSSRTQLEVGEPKSTLAVRKSKLTQAVLGVGRPKAAGGSGARYVTRGSGNQKKIKELPQTEEIIEEEDEDFNMRASNAPLDHTKVDTSVALGEPAAPPTPAATPHEQTNAGHSPRDGNENALVARIANLEALARNIPQNGNVRQIQADIASLTASNSSLTTQIAHLMTFQGDILTSRSHHAQILSLQAEMVSLRAELSNQNEMRTQMQALQQQLNQMQSQLSRVRELEREVARLQQLAGEVDRPRSTAPPETPVAKQLTPAVEDPEHRNLYSVPRVLGKRTRDADDSSFSELSPVEDASHSNLQPSRATSTERDIQPLRSPRKKPRRLDSLDSPFQESNLQEQERLAVPDTQSPRSESSRVFNQTQTQSNGREAGDNDRIPPSPLRHFRRLTDALTPIIEGEEEDNSQQISKYVNALFGAPSSSDSNAASVNAIVHQLEKQPIRTSWSSSNLNMLGAPPPGAKLDFLSHQPNPLPFSLHVQQPSYIGHPPIIIRNGRIERNDLMPVPESSQTDSPHTQTGETFKFGRVDPFAPEANRSQSEDESPVGINPAQLLVNGGSFNFDQEETLPASRTMFGTELDVDTRFGEFGIEGLQQEFWKAPGFQF
ncbi:hypothetical protein SISSUDRAFT_893589 [Sistotremastrum suecicum HHB10207 ss-3]|uniref:Uncharacterized protein n=1 Tax=Sistotremastrum suecicum HHB10207 ss-3 TaxID=1314776 RepID=A0A166HDA8_9AGAM|nr:hypothetical protein SISSUDRAFT_893589 [Sistotremastrum suecicum HHB10207 ss-3]